MSHIFLLDSNILKDVGIQQKIRKMNTEKLGKNRSPTSQIGQHPNSVTDISNQSTLSQSCYRH